MPNIEITATANVNQGVDGLKKVQQELGNTAIAAQKVDSTLGKTGTAIIGVGTSAKNAIPKVSELGTSFIKTHAQTLIFGAAMAGIGVAVAAASYWLKIVAKDFINTGNAAEDVGKKIKEYNDLVKSVTESVGKETTQVIGLLAVLKSETETRDRKLAAIKELQSIQPEVFKNLRLEKDAVVGLDEAYTSYITNLKNVIAAKILQARIESKITELLTLQGAANTKDQQAQLDKLKTLISTNATLSEIKKNLQDTKLGGGFLTDKQSATRIGELNDEIKGLFESLSEFTKDIKVKEIKVKVEKVKPEVDKLPKLDLLPQGDAIKGEKTILRPELTIIPNVKKVIVTPEDQQKVLDALQKMFDKAKLEAFQEDISTKIQSAFSNIASGIVDSFATTIGEALANGNFSLPDLFGGLIKGIGTQLKELGEYMVKVGVEYLVLKKALAALKLNPVAAIAAGFALEILGSALVASANKRTPQGFATGVSNYGGGVALVGERGPELVQLPRGSNVRTNGQLNAMGGNNQPMVADIVIRGTDLVAVFKKATSYNSRNGL